MAKILDYSDFYEKCLEGSISFDDLFWYFDTFLPNKFFYDTFSVVSAQEKGYTFEALRREDERNVQIVIDLYTDDKGTLHFVEKRYLYGDGCEDNKLYASGLTVSLSARKTAGRENFWKRIEKLVQDKEKVC